MLQSEGAEPDCCCFEGCSGNYCFVEDCSEDYSGGCSGGCFAGADSGCFGCRRVGFQCWAYWQRTLQCFGLFIGLQLLQVC